MAAAVKRALDLLVALLGLMLVSPLLLLIAVLVRLTMGKPVFFRQKRLGKGEMEFDLIKFRTMSDARGPGGELLPDAERLTRLGRFLRRCSLDELPNLWHVVVGQMSLVGPRPLLAEYRERYNARQRRRHEVRPGITGWAQVNGRNTVSWERKFELDVWYVDHWSLWLDLKILLLTFWKVLKREGISAEGEATMGEFQGTKGGGGA